MIALINIPIDELTHEICKVFAKFLITFIMALLPGLFLLNVNYNNKESKFAFNSVFHTHVFPCSRLFSRMLRFDGSSNSPLTIMMHEPFGCIDFPRHVLFFTMK